MCCTYVLHVYVAHACALQVSLWDEIIDTITLMAKQSKLQIKNKTDSIRPKIACIFIFIDKS